jgi:hypothetical protein
MYEENTNPWVSTALPAPAGAQTQTAEPTKTPPIPPIERGNDQNLSAETQSPVAITVPATVPP